MCSGGRGLASSWQGACDGRDNASAEQRNENGGPDTAVSRHGFAEARLVLRERPNGCELSCQLSSSSVQNVLRATRPLPWSAPARC
jgi:hypothetical protein